MAQGAFELTPRLCERFEEAGREFLLGFYETERRNRPENLAVLVELGHLYTRAGRIADGLEVDRELARRLPEDATVRYNLACSLCLSGDLENALVELRRAFERGYRDAAHLAADEDLAGLRADPRFAALLAELARDEGAG